MYKINKLYNNFWFEKYMKILYKIKKDIFSCATQGKTIHWKTLFECIEHYQKTKLQFLNISVTLIRFFYNDLSHISLMCLLLYFKNKSNFSFSAYNSLHAYFRLPPHIEDFYCATAEDQSTIRIISVESVGVSKVETPNRRV